MREVVRIGSQLKRAFEGGAWHGPSLRELLADVSAEQAAARPLPGAHSMWEIVLHIAAWQDFVTRAVERPRRGLLRRHVREKFSQRWAVPCPALEGALQLAPDSDHLSHSPSGNLPRRAQT